LIDPPIVATLALTPAEFFSPACRETFTAMREISGRGDLPIFTALVDELARRGGKVKPFALVEIAGQCPTSIYATEYAKRVRRASNRRRLLAASATVATAASDPALTASGAAELSASLIADSTVETSDDASVSDDRSLMDLFAGKRDAIRNGQGIGVTTGYYDLNRHLSGGFRGGQFCVIGARPGVGKSSMLRDMARSISGHGRVLFFSNEMGKIDLAARDISVLSEVPLTDVAGNTWNDLDEDRINQALTTREFMPILTVTDGAMTSEKVRAIARRVHHEEPIVAIVVDYIQRMADPGRTDLERVSKTARALKSIAMELDVPLIAGSQLSRTTERENQDTRPGLIDLRNSGEIEQEADIVLLLYRASYHYPTEATWKQARKTTAYPGNVAELIIAKQRQGASGVTVPLLWVPTLATFRNLARSER